MSIQVLSNPLGDIRAEADHPMLGKSFYETPDYLSLLASDEKVVVVGRRGTGKSALTYRLGKQWSKEKNDVLVTVAPDEHHTLALIPLVVKNGRNFLEVRAISRLLWKYGLIMEVVESLSNRYKIREVIGESDLLKKHLKQWAQPGRVFFERMRTLVKLATATASEPGEFIGDVADLLEINRVEKELKGLLRLGYKAYILVDRLDEGFDPNSMSVAFIDGAISAAIDLAAALKDGVRPVVFLRDNIYRAVAHYDQDYARNIEGQTLRLHWDVNNLFYLVCNRLRAAFRIEQENNKRLWNKFASHELQGEEGFKRCLSYTLYRPRDILILLNSALENASKRDASVSSITFSMQDIEKSAKVISLNRLDDLKKEYKQIFPSIEMAVGVFEGVAPEITMQTAAGKLIEVIENPPEDDHQTQLELAILDRPEELVRALYSVGFLGCHDASSGSFVFSHDGKRPVSEFRKEQRLLVHPCYWMALDIKQESVGEEQATEINDEYDIKVASQTPDIRIGKLNKLMAEYQTIPPGDQGSSDFEHWCLEAVKVCFAGRLENVVLHPNRDAINRRDIVGTNLGQPPCWQRIREDYEVRQVIFECKNYADLTLTDYRQLHSYLSDRYGRLGFFITRSASTALERDRELDWLRSIYNDHKVLIVKLTAKFLADLLGKLRNPKKHYTPDQLIGALLDTYERNYLGQPVTRRARSSRKSALSGSK
ncbi:hypothetical protein HNP48_000164 [Acidovorax soli]|uniref:Uncharacterized protein n=1 Tax=Acidovorax soli TaxID=592050 RepID=A0A7X0P902_9BURK|nr:ATP-binding protein [Acidovorax soli]MBB6557500.1 hypothetical protein [Acidovorax soli]